MRGRQEGEDRKEQRVGSTLAQPLPPERTGQVFCDLKQDAERIAGLGFGGDEWGTEGACSPGPEPVSHVMKSPLHRLGDCSAYRRLPSSLSLFSIPPTQQLRI